MIPLRPTRRHALALFGAVAVLRPLPVAAQSAPDPATVIGGFYATLLDCMKRGPELGFEGRYQLIEPSLNATFDVVTMCKIAIGPEWTKLSGGAKGALIVTFNKYMVTTYASRFKFFKNQEFRIGEASPAGDGRVLLKTQLIKSDGEAVELNYLFRLNKNAWSAIDVYLAGAISQVAQLRAEFATTMQTGGADALIASLEQKIADLRKES